MNRADIKKKLSEENKEFHIKNKLNGLEVMKEPEFRYCLQYDLAHVPTNLIRN